ncbi:hypothetical protein Poli38472_013326 [Pythium oligandrum]|uniref:BHLH domain-containing protein n=1 Tax=Pythium oligandrum TaxID=41045 RepID=A0A8K1C8D1_PYTOL|nr:hypothetical protein Poli38472_013326 [Pythium oligandrum]|eukprot:TMW57852.1 hypothetical protein Poli38472_013326 [Pythium oligandrum]
MATLQTTPPTTSASTGDHGAASSASSGNSSLEITYSTISPKVEQSGPYPMMNIKLNLIDQNPLSSNITTPNGDMASCESPFPMTPMTPGGSTDLSKKQRHNLREQRRILRISNQFDILRAKLENAGYSSAKKDKYSVLQATLEYISNLEQNQARSDGSNTSHAAPPSGAPSGLSITAPDKGGHSFMIDSMPSPVPALSMPNMQFPMNPMEPSMYPGSSSAGSPGYPVETIEGSTASYKDVFANSSMPSLLAKLDGTIVEANSLFLELSCKNIDELRLHSLYTMCSAMDAPKMYNLVNKILSCEMASAQSKMVWHFSNSGDRKVFVSVSMIHDRMHQPANLHCSLLPLS